MHIHKVLFCTLRLSHRIPTITPACFCFAFGFPLFIPCFIQIRQADLHGKQVLKLLLTNLFFFNQKLTAAVQHQTVLHNDIFRLLVTLIDDPFHLIVDHGCHTLAVASCVGQIASDKDLVFIAAIIDHAHLVRHTVLGYHRAGNLGGLLDILGRARGHILKDDLLGNPSSKRYHDILQHLALCIEHLILSRQRHRITSRPNPGRNDGNRVDRSHIRQHIEQDCMACLVVCSDTLFLLGDDPALFLRADPDLYEGTVDIFLTDEIVVFLCRNDSSLVHQVLKVRPGKSGSRLGHSRKIHILAEGFFLGMHLKDCFPAADIRTAHRHLAVKTPRTQDCRVKDIHPVGCSHHDDALVHAKSIHLHQKLVQCLLPLVMSAAHTGAAASGNRIDLVDKHDTRRILLRLFKQVADTGRAHAYKHLHKIGTGDREKRHARLSRHRFGQQGLSGSRRSHKDDSFGDPRAKAGIFLRIAEEINHLLQVFLLFLKTRHILKCHIAVVRDPRTALAKIHHLRIAAAACARPHIHHKNNQDNCPYRQKNRQDDRQPVVALRHIVGNKIDSLFLQQRLCLFDIRDIDDLLFPRRQRDQDLAGRRLLVLANPHRLNLSAIFQ